MNDKHNREAVMQADKTLHAVEWPRRQVNPRIEEGEELALRQIISSIILEWQEADNKKKRDHSNDEIMDGGGDELGEKADESVDRKEKCTQSQRGKKMG
eukprot:3426464-Pleurochrysis_carterae.AAC.3